MSNFRWLLAVLIAVAAIPVGVDAQQTGTITGQVLDGATGQPLPAAIVQVTGSVARANTNAEGRYTIQGVPAGSRTVSASLIGREGQSRPVTVVAGQTVSIDFRLTVQAIALDALVVTATGETQRRREVGNAVGRINVADDVPLASVNDFGQVLQGRTAGVSVLQSGGTTGTGSRIRIRGSNSVSLSNDPLVIVDGVRVESGAAGFGVGGQNASRQMDVNSEDIETLEVLKGPAASALYGTAAANGVIVVTTKRGRAGRTNVTAYAEYGALENVADFPGNYTAYCSFDSPTDANPALRRSFRDCDIGTFGEPSAFLTSRNISLDSVVSFNPLTDPRSSPFQTGQRRKLGMSASGGSEAVTYYLSGDLEGEDGIYQFDLSTLDRKSVRANIRSNFSSALDATVSVGYTNTEVRLPENDNNAFGVVSGSLLSRRVQFDSTSLGYGFGVTPRQIASVQTRNFADRITGSIQANARPLNWLSFTTQVGLDRVAGYDLRYFPPGEFPFSATTLEGSRNNFRAQTANYTANFNGTANFELTPSITSQTSAGVQYSEELSRSTQAFGAVLLPGVPSLQGATARFAVFEGNFQVRTIGGYAQQQFGLNDRLFVTGALRADDNSAFGNDFGLVYYPALSASWVVIEEPWFPQQDVLSALRLRAAYGSSGLRPGTLDAFQFFNPTAANIRGATVPGVAVGGAGNVNLRPEKSTEVELGFDLGFFDDRLGFEFTHFNKTSRDALINVPLSPSLGVAASRRENLGSVNNRGYEVLADLKLVTGPRFQWDARLAYSSLRNELTDLGGRETPIIFGLGGNTQRHTIGRPLGAYFAQPYTFADADGNGLITPSELTFTSDTTEFVGTPFPTREVSLSTNLQLTEWLRLSTLFDHRAGHKQFNSTAEFRCGSFFNCQDIFDGSTPLDRQAAAIASAYEDSSFGYIEDADFTKWRELSVTLGVPSSLARRFRAQGLSLTLAGRNLKTWTNYTGLDPEINFAGSGSNFTTAEFLSQPPVRYFTVRLDARF